MARKGTQAEREAFMRSRINSEIARGLYQPSAKTNAFLSGASSAQLRATKQPAELSVFKTLDRQLNREIDKILSPPNAKQKTQSRNGNLYADTSQSECFNSLFYSKSMGGVIATFANPTTGDWFYEMSKQQAREWFSDDLGRYFNSEVREPHGKGK